MKNPSYPWDPGDYARHSAAQQEWAQALIRRLALRGSERLLDLGCGDGRPTAQLAQDLPHGLAVGVDLSEAMVRAARERFPSRTHPRLHFCRMDAARLAFAPAFEVVFSNAALHWVQDHPAVLAGIARSLKPGGRVLLQMGGRGNAGEILAVLAGVLGRARWQAYFAGFAFPYFFYGPEEYRDWLPAAGLAARRVELLPKDMRHAGREGLAGWIRTTWLPYTGQVPAAEREAFIAEVAAAYLEGHPPDPDGTVHVQMVRLEVEAVKAA